MNIGKAPLLIAVFAAALFLLWEFVLVPMFGTSPPPRPELQQGTSKR